ESVTGRGFGIRTLRINLRSSAGCEKCRLPITARNMIIMLELNSDYPIIVDDQFAEEGERHDADVRIRTHAGEESVYDDFACQSSIAMDNARDTMPSLTGKGQRISFAFKIRSPLQQTADLCRTLLNQNAHRCRITKPCACCDRVGIVLLDVVI